MSSRAQEKARAREAREAAEREAATGTRRRRRVALLGGVLVAATVAIAVAIALSQSGVDDGPKRSGDEAAALFAGVPQDGPWLGRPDAPIVVEEFLDMQCPFCASFAREALPGIVADEVRAGRIRIRQRTLTFLGDDSVTAGRTVVAAGLQDRQWPYADAFFTRQGQENSGYVTDDFLDDLGADVGGLDMERVRADRDGPEVRRRLAEDQQAASRHGVEGTPAFLAGRRGGELKELELSALTPEGFRAALDRAVGER